MNVDQFKWLTLLIILTATVMICYWYVDVPVAVYIFEHPFFSELFDHLSVLGESQYYLGGTILLIGFFRNVERTIAYKALFILISLLIGSILAAIIKIVAGRMRPELFFNDSIYGFLGFQLEKICHSFPSSHATTAFAFFIGLVFIFPKQKTVWISLAVIAAVSRVIMLKHFVSDVVVGAFIGTISAYLAYFGYYRLSEMQKQSYRLHRLIFPRQ